VASILAPGEHCQLVANLVRLDHIEDESSEYQEGFAYKKKSPTGSRKTVADNTRPSEIATPIAATSGGVVAAAVVGTIQHFQQDMTSGLI